MGSRMVDEHSARGSFPAAPPVGPLVAPLVAPLAAPLVAVVTPVYNGAEFLAETLACVQRQTYPNLVHVVLDNASTDETPGIIAGVLAGSPDGAPRPRVPVLAHRNPEILPLRRNWERAVRLTPPEARYFLVLCADDLLAENAVAAMVAVAERDAEVGVVGCLWRFGRRPDATAQACRGGLPEARSVFDGRWFVKSYLLQMHFGTSPQCQMFRRSVLDEVPALYRHDEMLMDVDACLNTLLRSRYGFVHAPLGFTRVHEGRVTDAVMAPNKMFEANWLGLIERFGPHVMSARELRRCREAYARYYIRRLLVWRFRERNRALVARHRRELRGRDVGATPLRALHALAEWLWLAALNRRSRVSRATSLWAAVWRELPDGPRTAPEAGRERPRVSAAPS